MIQIQNRIMKLPIIQGGMGVGISLSSLAGLNAHCEHLAYALWNLHFLKFIILVTQIALSFF